MTTLKTFKSNGFLNDYLTILTDIGVNTSTWIENTKEVTDEFLDAIDFEEPIIVKEIIIHKTDQYQLNFLNTSTNDTFDPVITIFILNRCQYDDFLLKIDQYIIN